MFYYEAEEYFDFCVLDLACIRASWRICRSATPGTGIWGSICLVVREALWCGWAVCVFCIRTLLNLWLRGFKVLSVIGEGTLLFRNPLQTFLSLLVWCILDDVGW